MLAPFIIGVIMNIEDKLKAVSDNRYPDGGVLDCKIVRLEDALSICKEACEKQRKICYKEFELTNSPNAILNAPEPEL